MRRAQSRAAARSAAGYAQTCDLRGYLKRHVDARHGRDARMNTVVLQRDKRVERQQNLTLQIDLEAWRQVDSSDTFRQRDERRGGRCAGGGRRVCLERQLSGAKNLAAHDVEKQGRL